MHQLRPLAVIIMAGTAFALHAQTQTSDSLARRALEDLGITFTDGNTVELITTGREKFDLMFADLQAARCRVNLEYFNFRNDSIGNALFNLLATLVSQGVDVNAMYDSFGNSSNDAPLKNRHLAAIRATGVDVREFDPIKFPWFNHAFHRDHRKIVTIDGRVCYAGGMNVADYYIHGRPEYGEWRDMHMRLTGPVVHRYDSIFQRMWTDSFGEKIDALQPPCGQDMASGGDGAASDTASACADSLFCFPTFSGLTARQTATIGVVDRRPGRDSKLMRKAYVAAIDAAQERIQIVNPYPTNVRSVRRALRRALKRGVRLEMMVSAKSDVPITPDVVAREVRNLARHGADIYYNESGFYHSKTMAIDGRYCTIGSTNLDARSFLFDYEVNSFILDAHTTSQLEQIFEQDKETCSLFRAGDYRRRFNFGHRLQGWFFSLFRGFF